MRCGWIFWIRDGYWLGSSRGVISRGVLGLGRLVVMGCDGLMYAEPRTLRLMVSAAEIYEGHRVLAAV